MKLRKILLGASLGLAVLSLASCEKSSGSSRNTKIPYGEMSESKIIASVGDLKLNQLNYYKALKKKSDSNVVSKMKQALYANEIKTIKAVFANKTLADFKAANNADSSCDYVDLLTPTNKDGVDLFKLDGQELCFLDDNYIDADNKVLATADNYTVIRDNLVESINQALSTAILGSNTSGAIKQKNADDLRKQKNQFMSEKKRAGLNITSADLEYTLNTDDETKTPVFKRITDDFATLKDTDDFYKLFINTIYTKATNLYGLNHLYEICEDEYIAQYDDKYHKMVKNKNFLFGGEDDNTDNLKTKYNQAYQNLGTYHAIVIQFNSKADANKTFEESGVEFAKTDTLDEVINKYIKLYNTYYKYKPVDDTLDGTRAKGASDERFEFKVSSSKNELNDIDGTIKALITDTFDDDTYYLSEARNINNKYVLALRYDVDYVIASEDEDEDTVDYDDLGDKFSEAELASINTVLKYKVLSDSASSYANEYMKQDVYNRCNNKDKSDDIEIYDPYFELKFETSYKDSYESLKKTSDDTIFKIGDITYTVQDLYNDASVEFGSQVITDQLLLEYAYANFKDTYIDKDDIEDYEDDLDDAIKKFNDNKDSTYPKSIGKETFLFGTYGYTSKADVLKYSFVAEKSLTKYLQEVVYEAWATENGGLVLGNDGKPDKTVYNAIYNILQTGNSKYSELFTLNADHLLINIDDDNDGNPDDPKEFLDDMKTEEERTNFTNAVATLAKALYLETTFIQQEYESKTSVSSIVNSIRTRYEHGEDLLLSKVVEDTAKYEKYKDLYNQLPEVAGVKLTNWSDYNTYNFLFKSETLGEINQDSVNNYVKNFQDYVKNMYAACKKHSNSTEENYILNSYKYGTFFYYNSDTQDGNVISSVDQINDKTLCQTEFGFHVLILNSYSEPSSTQQTKDSDTTKAYEQISVLIHEDDEDDDKNVYVKVDAYNDLTKEINFNQLFVYYCRKQMGQSEKLSSKIASLINTLFGKAINTYTGNSFQTYLLLKKINIQSEDATVKAQIENELNYFERGITEYADSPEDSDFYGWLDLNWTRPTK